MTIPTLRQVRRPVTLADGSVQWEVATSVLDAGDLPFKELFVLTIVDPLDPKRDVLARVITPPELRRSDPTAPLYVKVAADDLTYLGGDPFARIANVDDVTALPRDRVVAVRNGVTTYLVSAVTLVYSNLTTATAAYKTFIDRLSTLVTDWRLATGGFVTTPSTDYPLPQVNAGVEAQAVAGYDTAKAARVTAEAARDAAQTAKDACEVGCTGDKLVYAFLVADVAFLEQAKQIVQGLTEGFQSSPTLNLTGGTTLTGPQTYTITAAFSQFVKDFDLGQGAYAGAPTTYEALLLQKRALRATYAAKVQTCAETCAALAAALAAAQLAVDTARASETGALAAVLAVCPTFNPVTGTLA